VLSRIKFSSDADGLKVMGIPALLEEQGLKPATINLRLRAIASFLQWALDVGLIERIPRFPKTISEQKRPPQALERAEVNRLLRELEKEGKSQRYSIRAAFALLRSPYL